MKLRTAIILLLILASITLGIYTYYIAPEQIPSHWDANGNINGYSSRLLGSFLIPLICIGLTAILYMVPKIDPLKNNFKKFKEEYEWFIVIFLIFMINIQGLATLWIMDIKINPNKMLPALFSMLLFYLSYFFKKIKRNWFAGIRTPWSLSSDIVWKKTHLLASKLCFIAALVTLLGNLFNTLAIWFIMVPLLVALLIPVPYSYFLYKKQSKTKN